MTFEVISFANKRKGLLKKQVLLAVNKRLGAVCQAPPLFQFLNSNGSEGRALRTKH